MEGIVSYCDELFKVLNNVPLFTEEHFTEMHILVEKIKTTAIEEEVNFLMRGK